MRIIICDDNPHDIHTYSIIVKNVLKQADIDAELLLYESPKKLRSFFLHFLHHICSELLM